MVDILRDQLRNYDADKTSSIKLANTAAAIQDVGNFVQTGAAVANNVGNIRDELAKPDIVEAENSFKEDSARLAKANAERLQKNPNIDASSDEHLAWYRGQAEKIFGTRSFDGKWQHAKDRYSDLRNSYVADGVAANIRYSAQQRTDAANASRAGSLKNADTSAEDYFAKMRALGGMGNMSDGQGLTTETLASINKALGDAGTPQQRQAALTQIATRGGMEWTIGLSQNNPELADAIVNSDDAFMKYMPSEFRDNILEMRRQEQTDRWGQERTMLESELSTTDARSPRGRELNKAIKALDKKINDFDKDEEFNKTTIREAREAFKQMVEPAMQKVNSERAFATRQAAFDKQKNIASSGVISYSPQLEWFLNERANEEKASRNMTKINPDTGQAYEMSPNENALPGQWEQMRDDYVGYRNEMTKVSPLVESAPASKAAVNDELFRLITSNTTDAEGDPTDFEAAALKFLHSMARAPITESERRDYANLVGQAMLMRNDEIQDLRDILSSGDVGVYSKGGAKGVIEYNSNQYVGNVKPGQNGTKILEDERSGFWTMDSSSNLKRGGKQTWNNSGNFDNMLKRTQADYQTKAVNMAVNGVSKQDIMNTKKQIFDKAINDWYSNRYVVDLAELDRKLENKQPAFQDIDGVIYEYKGRDSMGRPLWKDSSVLNTNRDFARINTSYKMGQQ